MRTVSKTVNPGSNPGRWRSSVKNFESPIAAMPVDDVQDAGDQQQRAGEYPPAAEQTALLVHA